MTRTYQKDIKEKLKLSAKCLTTVVSPPLGLPLFAKKKGGRIAGFIGGVMLSVAVNVGIHDISYNTIYDKKPEVKIYRSDGCSSDVRSLAEIFLSPLAFTLDSSRFTSIGENDGDSILGEAIVFLDGKYQSTLSHKSFFRVSPVYHTSLDESEKTIRSLEGELNGYI